MTLHVRGATAADLPALRDLFLRSRRAAFSWEPPETFALADFEAQTRGEAQWVATDPAGQLVGFASVWMPEHFLHHLYVDPARLRDGVGRALLQALPGWPATRYRLKCLTRNLRALAFYRACGFVEVGAGTADDGDYLLLASPDGDS